MDFDIKYEINQVVKIINDDKFDKSSFSLQYCSLPMKQNYLLNVTNMTMKYHKIETYLKNLLTKFSIDELELATYISKPCGNAYIFPQNIIFCMMFSVEKISLNALEITIKHYGININQRDLWGSGLLHHLFHHNYRYTTHIINIQNLFIKYGIDLNITNDFSATVLDKITYRENIRDQLKICIMTLLDNGAKSSKPKQYGNIWDFIEFYRYENIKPAIKNERNI